jgi:hypothetical protein
MTRLCYAVGDLRRLGRRFGRVSIWATAKAIGETFGRAPGKVAYAIPAKPEPTWHGK